MPDNVRAPNTSKPRVIVDCDPGLDDAIALMLAARYCQPLGITTVSGNVGLTHTTRNALAIAELLDCDVPVHAGAERPLLVESGHSGYIHGETGLGATTLPAPRKHPASADAVRFIVDTARREEGVWLLALGPLTNIALALRSAPDIVGRLAGISLMGGSTSVGNVTPAAEFNIWADPEAADMVFASGARLIMCGLNLTRQFVLGSEDIRRIGELGNASARFAADLLTFYGRAYRRLYNGNDEGPVHDPCAVLAVTHPELFELQERHVRVECAGHRTRGMTVVDERSLPEGEPANTEVAYRIDAARARELLLDAIQQLP